MSQHRPYFPLPDVWEGKAERYHLSASQFRRQQYAYTGLREIAAMSLQALIVILNQKLERDGKISAISRMPSPAPFGALRRAFWSGRRHRRMVDSSFLPHFICLAQQSKVPKVTDSNYNQPCRFFETKFQAVCSCWLLLRLQVLHRSATQRNRTKKFRCEEERRPD